MKPKKTLFTLCMAFVAVVASFQAKGIDLTPERDAKTGSWGFRDTTGKWVVKPKFDMAFPFEKRPNGAETSKVEYKGNIGFVDVNGKLLGPGTVFGKVEPLGDNTMLVKVKEKYGVADYNCVYIIKPDIDTLEPIDEDRFMVSIKDKKAIMKRDGRFQVAPDYEEIDLSIPGYIRVSKNGKAGLLDESGNMLYEPSGFTCMEPFGNYWKVKNGNKTGLFELGSKRLLVKTDYADVNTPIELNGITYYPVMGEKGWGLNLSEDNRVLNCEYLSVEPVYAGNYFFLHSADKGYQIWCPLEDVMLTATIDRKYDEKPFKIESYKVLRPSKKKAEGVFYRLFAGGLKLTRDQKGTLMPPSTQIVGTDGDAYVVSIDNRYWVYDSRGECAFGHPFPEKPVRHGNYWECNGRLFTPGSEELGYYSNMGVTYVELPDESCHLFVNDDIASTAYQKIKPIRNGMAGVMRSGKWGICRGVREIVPCNYESEPQYNDNIKGFIIAEGGKKGLVDENGAQILATEYDNIEHLNDEGIICWNDGLCGVFKTDGSSFLPVEFSDISHAGDGYRVKKGTLCGLYSNEGQLIIPAEYDEIEKREGLNPWVVTRNGKYGLIRDDGEMILPAEYTSFKVNNLSDNIWLGKDDLYGVCNSDGNIIVPVRYKDENLQIIDDYCYCAVDNTGKKYYSATGSLIHQKRTVVVTGQNVEHNHYDSNNSKGLKVNFNFEVNFSKDEPVYIEVLIYNVNGTPASSSRGGQIKHGYWRTPGYLCSVYKGQWITIPYNNFVQPKATKRDYYIKLRFKDGKGREIPTTGNDKISFYLTR